MSGREGEREKGIRERERERGRRIKSVLFQIRERERVLV